MMLEKEKVKSKKSFGVMIDLLIYRSTDARD